MPPSITTVSGTWNHGSSVTITGTSFGSKGGSDANKPRLFADFASSINPTSLGLVTSWDQVENFTRVGSGGPSPGAGMVEGGTNVTAWTLRTDFTAYNTYGQKTYIFTLAKKNFQVSCDASQNWKNVRFWASGVTTPDFYCGRDAWITEICSPTKFFACRDFNANTWAAQEFVIQANSGLNNADATALWYASHVGQTRSSSERGTTSLVTRCSGFDVNIILGFIVHFVAANEGTWVNPAWSTSNQCFAADVYYDNTWARILVGNASTLAACTQLSIQVPSAWADTSATITVNRGMFGASEAAYLYVIDSNNVASSGFQFTFGAGAEPPPSVLLGSFSNRYPIKWR